MKAIISTRILTRRPLNAHAHSDTPCRYPPFGESKLQSRLVDTQLVACGAHVLAHNLSGILAIELHVNHMHNARKDT